MSHSVRFTRLAERDFERIIVRILDTSLQSARQFAKKFNQRCDLLGRFPHLGIPRDDLAVNLRCSVVRPFVIYYQTDLNGIIVVRILHGSQDELAEFPE